MIRNLSVLLALVLLLSGNLAAQIAISGILIEENSRQPLSGVTIRTNLPDEVVSGSDGSFSVGHPEIRNIHLDILLNGILMSWETVLGNVISTDVGIVLVGTQRQANDLELPSITLEENDDRQDANISGLLQSRDDIFASITNYAFSPARFRRRGLDADLSEGYLNHLPVNDLESGSIFWSQWGGLNDVMRLDAVRVGAEIGDWGYGGVANSFNTDLRASSQWRQKRISYAVTNRNYRNRIMGTWSTGRLPSGWAVSLSGSRRWAQEGFIEGTFYDGWSYFASVDKKLGSNQSINLVALGSPYKRGGSSTSIQEMYDLADNHYYNSFWGYQQGEKRNGRIYSAHQPLFILRHDITFNDNVKLITALGYQTGFSSIEALDWLYGHDPRPDYYRRLPSYIQVPDLAAEVEALLREDESLRQIQWDKLYQVNLNSHDVIMDVDGISGNTVSGRLSKYVMEERRNDTNKKSGNIVLQYLAGKSGKLQLGLSAVYQRSRNYKTLADLLGGEFYIDWDKFAAQDFPGNDAAQQNDLQRPNRILHEGDQFGYDYVAKIDKHVGWLSYEWESRHWEAGVAASGSQVSYLREGRTQNGKFPDNSFGDGTRHSFFLPSARALFRYKIDGRNYLTVSGMYAEMAPSFRNAYLSPRTRDHAVDGLRSEVVQSGEIRYDLRAPYLRASASAFLVKSQHGIQTANFYHDDENTFINLSMTGIDTDYRGVELALEYRATSRLRLQGAASIGRYIYTSRPTATVTQDNNGQTLLSDITVYARNLYVAGTPQTAYTGGASYHSPKYWSLYVNVNRFENNWINFNPIRRTAQAVELVEYQSDQWEKILSQEKTDPAWTLDISFYKSWRANWVKNRAIIALNIGITNLLNNQDYINGGYEQYRFDFDNRNPDTFPSRYSYMQGLNYFIQGSLRF